MNETESLFVRYSAYCPFYICESTKGIVCEGIVSRKIDNRFKSEMHKEHHQIKYCNDDNCVNCPVYKAINAKYEE